MWKDEEVAIERVLCWPWKFEVSFVICIGFLNYCWIL